MEKQETADFEKPSNIFSCPVQKVGQILVVSLLQCKFFGFAFLKTIYKKSPGSDIFFRFVILLHPCKFFYRY